MPTATRHQLNLAWTIRLRWAALVSQAMTVALSAWLLKLELPIAAMVLVMCVGLATNLAATWLQRRHAEVTERLLAVMLALDLVGLTGLLYLSGGPSNPFNFLYLVHIALATVVLSPRLTWALALLSALLFGGLFIDHVPLTFQADVAGAHADHHAHMGHSQAQMDLHLRGMWVAFVVAAAFIIAFVTRVTAALARREDELAQTRLAMARSQRLNALATLSAGAAHELSTPLGTIAVASRELERELKSMALAPELLEDLQLIRDQVRVCRRILDQLSAQTGQSPGEGIEQLSLGALLAQILEEFPKRDCVELQVSEQDASRTVRLQPSTISVALRNLLDNACRASRPQQRIELRASADGDTLTLALRDHGEGMAPDILERAGEPFFTTRETGQGMGLGLFLARASVEQMHGALRIDSRPGLGTTVTITLPRMAPT